MRANAFSQVKSLTVDCQNPGWLSSMINYSDQLTLENIKVTGYINGTDLQFIKDLNIKRSLTGTIDLEWANIVSGGILEKYPYTVLKDNVFPYEVFRGCRDVVKLVCPNTLMSSDDTGYLGINGDSLIWTSPIMDIIYVHGHNFKYVNIPDGVTNVYFTDSYADQTLSVTLPNSIKSIAGHASNITVFSMIENPGLVEAQYETYNSVDGRRFWTPIGSSTFYIPKGSLEQYQNSDLAKLNEIWGYTGKPNNNIFIEYYDIDSTIVKIPEYIYVGDTIPVEIQIIPDDTFVSWIDYSYNETDIIEIINNVIIGKKYGRAQIYATPHLFIEGLETKTDSFFVNVVAHTEGIEMPSSMIIHINERKQLNANTLPLGISDNQILFESLNSSIAEVDTHGVIVGHNKGTCTIIATSVDGAYQAECVVKVIQSVEELSLDKHELSLKVGDTDRLFSQILPITADDKSVIWLSSDNQVASVDSIGNVAAIKSGEATIKAISNDNNEIKDSCKIVVIQPVTGMNLSQSICTLTGIGESIQLEAYVQPEDASNKEVRWSSSNESVCIVSQGKVISTGFGTAVVIASTVDGGFIDSCVINVENTSAIEDTTSEDQKTSAIYDLMGFKVNNVKKGRLYIHNGKKLIFK